MPLKDVLRKKDKVVNEATEAIEAAPPPLPHANQFRFMRTETDVEEDIPLPSFEEDKDESTPQSPPRRGFGRFRKSSDASPASSPSRKEHKRLSQRLHLGSKSRASSTSSANVPVDLPSIDDAYNNGTDKQEKEAQWEERATILARENPTAHNRPPTAEMEKLALTSPSDSSSSSGRRRSVSDAAGDVDIQEAIRLHEEGDLPTATEMFRKLADQGNVLSQVLYGLSLRHGWGCAKDETLAVKYLSQAASSSATIEAEALKAGIKKGGAAKGELVLSIFELGNCFRYGWGVPIDKVAARQYYETAANLGDTDAMNEAAWCYLEGFGGKKDKVSDSTFCYFAANEIFRFSPSSHICPVEVEPNQLHRQNCSTCLQTAM